MVVYVNFKVVAFPTCRRLSFSPGSSSTDLDTSLLDTSLLGGLNYSLAGVKAEWKQAGNTEWNENHLGNHNVKGPIQTSILQQHSGLYDDALTSYGELRSLLDAEHKAHKAAEHNAAANTDIDQKIAHSLFQTLVQFQQIMVIEYAWTIKEMSYQLSLMAALGGSDSAEKSLLQKQIADKQQEKAALLAQLKENMELLGKIRSGELVLKPREMLKGEKISGAGGRSLYDHWIAQAGCMYSHIFGDYVVSPLEGEIPAFDVLQLKAGGFEDGISRTQHYELNAKYQELEAEFKLQSAEIADLKAKNATLTDRLETVSQEQDQAIDELNKALAELRLANEEFEKQLTTAQQENEALRREKEEALTTAQKESEQLRGELAAAEKANEEALAAAQQTLKEKEDALAAAEERHRQELEKLRATNEALTGEHDEALRAKEEALTTAKRAKESALEELTAQQERADAVEAAGREKDEALASAQKEHAEALRAKEEALAAAKQENDKLRLANEEALAAAKQENDKLRLANEELVAAGKANEEELAKLREALAAAGKANEELTSAKRANEEELTAAQQEKEEELTAAQQEKEEALAAAQQQLAAAQQQLAAAQQALRKKDKEHSEELAKAKRSGADLFVGQKFSGIKTKAAFIAYLMNLAKELGLDLSDVTAAQDGLESLLKQVQTNAPAEDPIDYLTGLVQAAGEDWKRKYEELYGVFLTMARNRQIEKAPAGQTSDAMCLNANELIARALLLAN